MYSLSQLKNTTRPKKASRRVGRGVGSKRGKNAGRGEKGDSHRQGYRKRFGYEGGQVPLYRKLPIRGFTRGRFIKTSVAITLERIEAYFNDGDTVNEASLREKGLIPRKVPGGIRIIAKGELTKKVKIQASHFSEGAQAKLSEKKIPFTKV